MGTAKAVGRTLIAALALSAVFSAGAQAHPGVLDPTFSGDGKQTTDFGFGADDQGTGVALQGDGKIVVAGVAGGGATGNDFALARYNPNGTLDPNFSGDGKRRTNFGGSDQARGVAIQANGRIVAVGYGGPGGALARYNPDGSLDTSFSGDGKQTTNFLAPNGVAIQANGKIVVAGVAGGGATGNDFALARYNPNGSLDTSFSGDGNRRTNFSFGSADEANGVALQANGKIVAVGVSADENRNRNFAIARYNPDGSLDTSFSGDGKQTTDFFGGTFGEVDRARAVVIQGNGKIVVVGVGAASEGYFAIARYNLDGSLDAGFSGDGKQTTTFAGFSDAANGVALQTDGKIVAVGSAYGIGGMAVHNFALARYNPNGSLDTSFSGDGKKTTSFGGSDGATGVAIQANGRIVVVGRAGVTLTNDDFAVARYFGG